MRTYVIVNSENQIIYENENYLDTVNEYQRLKNIDNQYLTLKVKKERN
jgi:hypothetical protein